MPEVASTQEKERCQLLQCLLALFGSWEISAFARIESAAVNSALPALHAPLA
jgi:hypothetical protein